MRITCVLCVLLLITTGICGGVYAFTGFNLIKFLCLNNEFMFRSYLAVSSVAALFTIYSLIVFKPFKGLK